jgi:putative DNA primase/helicase
MQAVTQNDAGMITILQAWLNACVKGRVDLHRYLELIGPASTGKSTFLRLAMALVGENNTVTTDLKQLEQNRFESASLYGMRLCLITDSHRYGGAVDVLKAITGGDPVRFEEKHCPKGKSFIPQCLVMVAANEPIQAADYTSGLQRRRLTLPFTYRIPPERRDSTLETRLHAELPGLLNWALALDDERVAAVLRRPEEHSSRIAAMTKSYLTDTNPLAAWLDECVLYMPQGFTKIGALDSDGGTTQRAYHLYPNYVYFCHTTGCCPLAQRRFSHILLDLCESLGYAVTRQRKTEGWVIKGLTLKQGEAFYTPSMVTQFTSSQETL